MHTNTPERLKLANEVGIRILFCRKQLSLTRKELAAKVGCTDRMIEFYEDGQRLPDVEAVVHLCEALSVDANYLTGVRRLRQ